MFTLRSVPCTCETVTNFTTANDQNMKLYGAGVNLIHNYCSSLLLSFSLFSNIAAQRFSFVSVTVTSILKDSMEDITSYDVGVWNAI